MAMQDSSEAPTRNRTVAVVEIGVLAALGALLVLAIIVGPWNGADADPDVAAALIGDRQESDAASGEAAGHR